MIRTTLRTLASLTTAAAVATLGACAEPDLPPTGLGERALPDTLTHRRVCAVVAPLTKDLAEGAICARATELGVPDLCGGWTAYNRYDNNAGPIAWHQCLQGTHALMDLYEDAYSAGALFGVRQYRGLVAPVEVGLPANTVDSIYAGHTLLTDGYDPALPTRDHHASIAAYAEQGLLSPLLFPPRAYFP